MQINVIGDEKFENAIINYLSILKPATTAIILSPTKTDLKDIILYTIIDLCLREVLSVEHKCIKLHPSDPYKHLRTTVETDAAYATYQPNTLETYFLGILDKDSYFQLYTYLQRVFHETPMDATVKKWLLKHQNVTNLFSVRFSFDSFSIFRLNRNGRKVRDELQRYFNALEANLPKLMHTNPEQALDIFSFIKGHFFMLKNLDTSVIKTANELIKNQKNTLSEKYKDLYTIHEFPDVFLNDVVGELIQNLQSIEKVYNKRNTSNTNDTYDTFL